MRKSSSDFKTQFVSEKGSIDVNRDFSGFKELEDMACWVVANGTDTDSAKLVVNSILSNFERKPTMSKSGIKEYINKAHSVIRKKNENTPEEVSVIVLLSDYSKIRYAISGNARLYLFRDEKLMFRSKDQSISQRKANEKKITEEDVNLHPEKDELENYIGIKQGFNPFISTLYKLNAGDKMLMCTSGFWGTMDDGEIQEGVRSAEDQDKVLPALEKLLLAQQCYFKNYTIFTIAVNRIYTEKSGISKINTKNILKKSATIIVPLLILGCIFLAYKIIDDNKTRAYIVTCEADGDKYVKGGSFEKALQPYEDAKKSLSKVMKKDKERDSRINIKCYVTQMIVDGDGYFKTKDYEEALGKYQEAVKEIDSESTYDKKELQDRSKKAQNYITIMKIYNQGDNSASKENYQEAIASYEKAQTIAEQSNYFDILEDLKKKMTEANSKLSDNKKNADDKAAEEKDITDISKQALDYEKKGDRSQASNDFNAALAFYEMARDEYNKVDTEVYRKSKQYSELGIGKAISNIQGKIVASNKIIEEAQKKAQEEKKSEDTGKAEDAKPKAEADKVQATPNAGGG